MTEQPADGIDELRRRAHAATNEKDRAEAVSRLAVGLRRSGRTGEALAAARAAAELFARLDAAAPGALLALMGGELLVQLGREDEAAHRLAEARHALEATGASPALVTRCERLLADVSRRRGRLDDAERWLGSARERYAAAGAMRAVAACDHDLGVLFHALGDTAVAIAALRSARSELMGLRDREGVASCGFNLGVALHDVGECDDAIDHYQQARSIFEAVGRREDAAGCDQNIAAALFDIGRVEEAGQRLMVAQAAYRELGAVRRVAECDADLAQVLRASGRAEAATAYLARARDQGVEDPAGMTSASA